MPRALLQRADRLGPITDDDLKLPSPAQSPHLRPTDVAALKAAAREPGERGACACRRSPRSPPMPAVRTGPDFIDERFGAWAAAYFDEGQALWAAPRAKSAFAAWRAFATQDLTPEIIGLNGFAAFVADAPGMAPISSSGGRRRRWV